MPSIECTLHGNLEDNLPRGSKGNRTTLRFESVPSVQDILSTLDIDGDNIQFALIDGQYLDFEHWMEPIRAKRIQLWPRISGG